MRAITVIGPPHSGKSTLVDAISKLDGSRSQSLTLMGDVSLTTFDYMGESWAALDVPGGLDNLADVGRCLAVSDGAVLCAPAEADAAVLSAPYLRLLEEAGVPTFVFLNKVDTASGRISEIVARLQPYCAHGMILRQVPMRSGDTITGAIDLISERAWQYREGERSRLVEVPQSMVAREEDARSDLLEALADFDDNLLEEIIEDKRPETDELYEVATRVLQHHDLVPVLLGAASHGNGIQRLMKSLRHEVPAADAIMARDSLSQDVRASSCAGDFVRHVGKVVLLRAVGESLSPGITMGGDRVGGLLDIDLKTQMTDVPAGTFCVAVKSDHLPVGRHLTETGAVDFPAWADMRTPGPTRSVRPVHERDDGKLSAALDRLQGVDPAAHLAQDEAGGGWLMSTQGEKHLQRLLDKLDTGFGVEAACSERPTPLRETIRGEKTKQYRHRKQSGGAGQFADVVLTVRPQPMGAGFVFEETVKGGAVPRNYIPSVAEGAQEALATGPAGYPVVDVSVTLTDGKSHSVDSSDFAFRTAGRSAVREAVAEIGTVVLQPVQRVEIHVPSVFSGELVQMVGGLKGQVLGFEGHPTAAGWDVFRALLPMGAIDEALRALGAVTRGTGWLTAEFDHYEELRDQRLVRSGT